MSQATTAPPPFAAPSLAGKVLYHCLPIRRRVVLANLRRVFGSDAGGTIVRLAQAHYGHLGRMAVELLQWPFLSPAAKAARVRVENIDAILRVHAQGKGVLILTGHFGNWEIATVAGIASFPQYRGQFYFLRRPLFPRWLDRLVTRRFRRAGLQVLPKKGALAAILDRLAAGDAIIFVFDQFAAGRDGIAVELFGHLTGTFRSLAILALATGAPVVPAACWREPDGTHVLCFEEALPLITCADPAEAIRQNTRAYNAMLERLILRHPEQWFWMHRRWKD
jgi:KDO2-lipid IV(A) lauroyltransferase